MNRILNTGLIALLFGLVTACENEIDNYEAPNGGVYGSIYDKETHEPIPMPVAGSSGVMISLYEQNTGATASVDFRAIPYLFRVQVWMFLSWMTINCHSFMMSRFPMRR